ncbi:MAG: hypothetical protein ABI813_00875 [Bacteroidota bacterium]
MKYPILILFLVTALAADAQEFTDSISGKETTILLKKLRLQQASPSERAVLQKTALSLQVTGQSLDERSHDYKKSLSQIDKAIDLYEALNDTLSLAFNKKYKGHLLVRLDKLSQAKTEIRAAASLYGAARSGTGVASSQFDLARIFEFENNPDSAVYYAGLAGSYWKTQGDNQQILVINNMMVYHLLQLSEVEKALLIYQESQLLLTKHPPHWQPLLDFYFTSMLLFRQINDATNAAHYRELYTGQVDVLRTEGITARSYYDNMSQ